MAQTAFIILTMSRGFSRSAYNNKRQQETDDTNGSQGSSNSEYGAIKGELKAEISNFSNIFFAKSNISEVNFVKLFSLVYCFLRENYVRSWIFPAFATSSLWAQKLNQQPAVTYDMGKDGEERFRNQEKQGKHKWCTAIHHYG